MSHTIQKLGERSRCWLGRILQKFASSPVPPTALPHSPYGWQHHHHNVGTCQTRSLEGSPDLCVSMPWPVQWRLTTVLIKCNVWGHEYGMTCDLGGSWVQMTSQTRGLSHENVQETSIYRNGCERTSYCCSYRSHDFSSRPQSRTELLLASLDGGRGAHRTARF